MDVVGLVAVGAVLAAGSGFGLWRHRNDGRLRPVSPAKDAAGPAKDAAGVAVESARAGRPAAEPRSVVTPDVE